MGNLHRINDAIKVTLFDVICFFLGYSLVAKAFRKKSFSNSGNDDYLPYVPAFNPLSTNNIIIPVPVIPITQDINSPEFLIADDHLVHNEPDDSEPAKITVIPLILKTP
ncbi:hypothetical protein Tco_1530583 [Tanacetum coccineum]